RLVELHHLPTASVHAWEHSDEGLARQLRRAESIPAECADADERFRAGLPAAAVGGVFPPRPGPACGACDYRLHCPEGKGASAPGRGGVGVGEVYPAGVFSTEFQNEVRVLATVSGASTAGEWAAPGMHTRWAFSRRAISSWSDGAQASSFSP